MNYKVTILGKSYDLPPRTLAVDERIEAIAELSKSYAKKSITRREAVEQMHAFVDELAHGALPSVEEVDTNELFSACESIIEAYAAPARKAKNDAHMAELRDLLARSEVQKILTALPYMRK